MFRLLTANYIIIIYTWTCHISAEKKVNPQLYMYMMSCTCTFKRDWLMILSIIRINWNITNTLLTKAILRAIMDSWSTVYIILLIIRECESKNGPQLFGTFGENASKAQLVNVNCMLAMDYCTVCTCTHVSIVFLMSHDCVAKLNDHVVNTILCTCTLHMFPFKTIDGS